MVRSMLDTCINHKDMHASKMKGNNENRALFFSFYSMPQAGRDGA